MAADQPVAAVLFYRSHLQAANTAFIDVFCQRLQAAGLNPLPIAVASLKEPGCLAVVEDWLDEVGAAVILNTTGLPNPALKRRICARFAAISR
jgi:cobaltochelatase CobN